MATEAGRLKYKTPTGRRAKHFSWRALAAIWHTINVLSTILQPGEPEHHLQLDGVVYFVL